MKTHHSHKHNQNGESHSHDHGHGHGHSHGHHHVSNFGRAFAIGIGLNLLFVVIEASYGFLSNSLALLSDAGHNLSDVLGLFLAWFATWLARRKPNSKFTYGLRSSSILAAVINAVILLLAVGGIIWEAVARFNSPAPVHSSTVMIVAGVGILVNGITAYLFMSGSKSDLNIRGAFLHMVADALVSLGVVIAGFIMMKTNLGWIDPVVSILIGIIIVWSTWGLLKDSIFLALAGVPAGIDKDKVERYLVEHDEIERIHDVHIWALSTSQTAMTAHIVRSGSEFSDRFLYEVGEKLNEKFNIQHVTLQVERGDDPKYICPRDSGVCI